MRIYLCRSEILICLHADCDFGSVEKVNGRHLLPILSELVRKPFFRYFKVNLYCDCPFWPDDGMCSLRDCSVCECDNNEIPQLLLAADRGECEGAILIGICERHLKDP